MATVRRTASTVSVPPFSMSSMSSEKSRSAVALSAGAPVMVISLPRTCTSLARVRSTSRRISSLGPSRFTMIFGSETEILVCTRAAALLCSVPVIGAAVRPTPPALVLVPAVPAACVRIVPSYPLGARPRRGHYRRRWPGALSRGDGYVVEGLLDAGEAVGGPVHPDHPRRRRRGSGAAARPLRGRRRVRSRSGWSGAGGRSTAGGRRGRRHRGPAGCRRARRRRARSPRSTTGPGSIGIPAGRPGPATRAGCRPGRPRRRW